MDNGYKEKLVGLSYNEKRVLETIEKAPVMQDVHESLLAKKLLLNLPEVQEIVQELIRMKLITRESGSLEPYSL